MFASENQITNYDDYGLRFASIASLQLKMINMSMTNGEYKIVVSG